MSTIPFLAPRVRGQLSPKGAPAIAAGNFTTNGASAPVVKGGIISSVRRLVDGGAAPFFRVKLGARYPVANVDSCITLGVETVLPDAPAYATLVTDLITPAPADVRASDEIDIAVFLHSTDTRVDTAGSKVSFVLMFSQ